jgi:HK97 family phage major capsid protein
VAAADPTEAPIFDAQGRLLRKPVEEVPFLPDLDVIYGDVRAGFTIVDRLGATIEPTGVHFNPTTGVPSGHRGFLLLWRSGSRVVDADAHRLLAEVS